MSGNTLSDELDVYEDHVFIHPLPRPRDYRIEKRKEGGLRLIPTRVFDTAYLESVGGADIDVYRSGRITMIVSVIDEKSSEGLRYLRALLQKTVRTIDGDNPPTFLETIDAKSYSYDSIYTSDMAKTGWHPSHKAGMLIHLVLSRSKEMLICFTGLGYSPFGDEPLCEGLISIDVYIRPNILWMISKE